MDYLLDRYIFDYLPFQISDELKKSISSSLMSVVKYADWFCKTQDVWNFFENHFTFLAAEIFYFLLFAFTLLHAIRLGGRYIYTWLGISMLIFHQEYFQLGKPQFDFQWHSQGLLSFCGGRIPISSVLGVRHVAIYSAVVLSERAFIPAFIFPAREYASIQEHLAYFGFYGIQCFAASILALIIKLPYDFLGTYFLWWTWDYGNPLIQEKIYGVPWILFADDASLTSAFVFVLHFTRHFAAEETYNWKKFVEEFLMVAISARVALLFFTFISTHIVIFGFFLSIRTMVLIIISFQILVVIFDILTYEKHSFNLYWFDELSFVVCIHFIFLMLLVVFYNPIYVVSRGFHQPIGPCQEKSPLVREELGLEMGKLGLGKLFSFSTKLDKSTYFCLNGTGSEYFDFHCVPGGKPVIDDDIVEWYTICGKESNYDYQWEYIYLIWYFFNFLGESSVRLVDKREMISYPLSYFLIQPEKSLVMDI
ncbi:unnamed protein product [Meloidogyne enterolobii]|uniref:Uncharacterized protein n=1 Tax=Meloidogyne enterolobii TaxID=390850 RepID=A0ACB1AAM8_MELEN